MHSITQATGEAQGSLLPTPQTVTEHVQRNMNEMGRTVILEFTEPEGIFIPVGATGKVWKGYRTGKETERNARNQLKRKANRLRDD